MRTMKLVFALVLMAVVVVFFVLCLLHLTLLLFCGTIACSWMFYSAAICAEDSRNIATKLHCAPTRARKRPVYLPEGFSHVVKDVFLFLAIAFATLLLRIPKEANAPLLTLVAIYLIGHELINKARPTLVIRGKVRTSIRIDTHYADPAPASA